MLSPNKGELSQQPPAVDEQTLLRLAYVASIGELTPQQYEGLQAGLQAAAVELPSYVGGERTGMYL